MARPPPGFRAIPKHPQYLVSRDGRILSTKSGVAKPIKPWPNNHGYLKFTASERNRKTRIYVHIAVATVFIGKRPFRKAEVRHLNGDHKNNAVANLKWGTKLENAQDMIRHGHHGSITKPWRVARGARHGWRRHPESIPRGEKAPGATITERQAIRVIKMLRDNPDMSLSECARRLAISRNVVKFIDNGKAWKHLPRGAH